MIPGGDMNFSALAQRDTLLVFHWDYFEFYTHFLAITGKSCKPHKAGSKAPLEAAHVRCLTSLLDGYLPPAIFFWEAEHWNCLICLFGYWTGLNTQHFHLRLTQKVAVCNRGHAAVFYYAALSA